VRNLADTVADTIARQELDPGRQVRDVLADLRTLTGAGERGFPA